MELQQYLKNLTPPKGPIDIILDTDAYNEIDDQFAISYMVKNTEKFRVKGICAAPFLNQKSVSPADGMEKSYDEILKLLTFMGKEELIPLVHRGSETYLPDETTPVNSDAADFMAETAKSYTAENPLYIVAIGAITNVASAILKNPAMAETCVFVWLGGHGVHIPNAATEFNRVQDIAGARVLLGCGAPVVLLPCFGVVDHVTISKQELEYWLLGKNDLCTYLCENTVQEAESYAAGKPWTRVIWDITAVAWLLNENHRFMEDKLISSPIPEYDRHYVTETNRHFAKYVWHINRDALFEDLFRVLAE